MTDSPNRRGQAGSKCSLSSAGDDLPVRKPENAKVSVVESREQCDGIERLKKLQNYVSECEKQTCKAKFVNKTANTAGECKEPAPAESEYAESSSELQKGESRRAVKRKPKGIKINPFLADPRRKDHPLLPVPRPPRSVEIIGGDVLGQCECVKRNGLQSDCPKWDCGTDLCLQWPIPACQPSGLGVPIVKESRVKQPDPPKCGLTPSEKELAEKTLAKERRKEEVRLIKHARDNWKNGKQQAELQKAANIQKGYLKCKIHSGMYRLVPLMRNAKTQTELIENEENLCICPCEEVEKLEESNSNMKTAVKEQTPLTEPEIVLKKEPVNQESVRTSTTGIPTAKALKEKLKKP